jgi:hypothetical protein
VIDYRKLYTVMTIHDPRLYTCDDPVFYTIKAFNYNDHVFDTTKTAMIICISDENISCPMFYATKAPVVPYSIQRRHQLACAKYDEDTYNHVSCTIMAPMIIYVIRQMQQ